MWLQWVLVVGMGQERDAAIKVIRMLQQHGDIVDHQVGSGNWMLVK